MGQLQARVRDFADTVAARAQNDPAFARALLADEIDKLAKNLRRMLSQSGDPTMTNVSAIFAAITRALKVEVRAQVVMA